jgi:hypothetical protein
MRGSRYASRSMMSLYQINLLNIWLMIASLCAALIVPFELFLFS